MTTAAPTTPRSTLPQCFNMFASAMINIHR
uniref:Uncharacterized protein n=1 Tax=Anguilla anguilla TaxID=7936 RepID=A0A0E9URP0_ANGAN